MVPPAWVFLTGPLNFQSSTVLRERMRGPARRPKT